MELQIRGVSKTYPNGVRALTNVDLTIPRGMYGLLKGIVTVGLVLFWPLLAPPARRVWATLGVLLVLLVGLTRMWLGVHYLSDVLAGWALGLGWSLLTAVALGVLPAGRREST